MKLFLMIFPRISLHCTLVPVQYREYETGLLGHSGKKSLIILIIPVSVSFSVACNGIENAIILFWRLRPVMHGKWYLIRVKNKGLSISHTQSGLFRGLTQIFRRAHAFLREPLLPPPPPQSGNLPYGTSHITSIFLLLLLLLLQRTKLSVTLLRCLHLLHKLSLPIESHSGQVIVNSICSERSHTYLVLRLVNL